MSEVYLTDFWSCLRWVCPAKIHLWEYLFIIWSYKNAVDAFPADTDVSLEAVCQSAYFDYISINY